MVLNLTTIEKWKLFVLLTKDVRISRKEGSNNEFDLIFDFSRVIIRPRFNRVKAIAGEEHIGNQLQSYKTKDGDLIYVHVFSYIFSEYAYEDKDLIETVIMDKKDLNNQEAFILEIYNNRMYLDGIDKGDRVLVLKQDFIESHEEIAVFSIENHLAELGRLQLYEDKYLIKYSNPKLPIKIVNVRAVDILGKVWEIQSYRKPQKNTQINDGNDNNDGNIL